MERSGEHSLGCYTEKPCVSQPDFTSFFAQGPQGLSSRAQALLELLGLGPAEVLI